MQSPRRPKRWGSDARVALVASLIALSGAMPPRAWATPPPQSEPSAADRETARTLVGVGNEKMQQKDFARALEAYRQAHAIMRVPTTGILLASAQEALGQLLDAHQTLVQVTLHPQQPKEPTAFAKARETAKNKIAAIEPRVPSLQVSVTASDGKPIEDLEVRFDAAGLSGIAATLPRKVNPGEHTVSATAKGYASQPVSITIAEAEQKAVSLVLEPARVVPLVPPPPVASSTTAPASTSAAPVAPSVATTAPPPIEQPSAKSYKPAVVWTSFAVGAAGLIAGAVSGGLSLQAASSAKQKCPEYPNPCANEDARPDHDRAIVLANVSNATLVVGGVGIVAGVLSLVLIPGPLFPSSQPRRKSDNSAGGAMVPLIGPLSAGFAGRF